MMFIHIFLRAARCECEARAVDTKRQTDAAPDGSRRASVAHRLGGRWPHRKLQRPVSALSRAISDVVSWPMALGPAYGNRSGPAAGQTLT